LKSANVNSCGACFRAQKVGKLLKVVSQVLRLLQFGIELLSTLLFLFFAKFNFSRLFFGNFGLSFGVSFLLTDQFKLSFSLHTLISLAPKC